MGRPAKLASLEKVPTGITGLDDITHGGLPKGRTSLICGNAGCGKTLFALEFLARGAMQFNEPGVFMMFEESAEELTKNVASLGFDLKRLQNQNMIALDQIKVERNEIEETGEYDLEGLFIRLGFAIDSIGAKRVVLDTIETLFGGLSNPAILRSELRRLFRWLNDRGVTAIVTGERGDGQLTRQGLEEYVSDCVILLDHRVQDQLSTRRLRIVKYRGSSHGSNEYPFLIDEAGISVLPVTSMALQHDISDERVSSGVPALDEMLGGKGFFRGSSVLVSGTAGTGKSSLSAHLADATCRGGGRCLYFAFEESPKQIARNMRSIGLDLEQWMKKGRLHIESTRSTLFGLEMHLVRIHKMVEEFEPDVVIVDPITNFITVGQQAEVQAMLLRLMDFLKAKKITAFFVALTGGGRDLETTEAQVSSLIDTWLLVRDIELAGERNRGLYVLKSRGMAHSNQIREFKMTDRGIDLLPVYVGAEGVLTGSMRIAQEAREEAAAQIQRDDLARRKRELESKRRLLEVQIASLRAEFENVEVEAGILDTESRARVDTVSRAREAMQRIRGGSGGAGRKAPTNGDAPVKRRK